MGLPIKGITMITNVHPTILKNVFRTYVSMFSSMSFLSISFENFLKSRLLYNVWCLLCFSTARVISIKYDNQKQISRMIVRY